MVSIFNKQFINIFFILLYLFSDVMLRFFWTPYIIDDEEDYFNHFQIGYENKGKEVLFETIQEIKDVYPEIKFESTPYEICFDEFMKHIVGSNKDFAVSIAIFKVSCWKKADKIMKLNRFFS